MKENIKEDIKTVEYNMKCIRNVMNNFEDELCENMQTKTDEVSKIIDNILSDYKRALKENEELKQDRNNNYQMIALAQNDMLNYQAGFEDGKNGRTSAVQSIIENQQYYIFQKQIEKYERHIKKLQKESEELKNQEATARKINELLVQRYSNSISVQKVKDKIKEYKNMLKTCNKVKDIDRIKAINERILELQELLEGRK